MDDVPSSLSIMVHQAERMVLADPEKMTAEEAARLVDLIDAMKRRLREVNDQCNRTLMEYIKKNGDLEVGESRYYVGSEKRVKCRGNEATTKAIVEATDGDISSLAAALCSDPWKHGHVRTVLGNDKFDELFLTEAVEDVKTGKPRKVLKKANDKYGRKEMTDGD